MYFEIEKQAIDAISDALDKFEVDDTLENFQVEIVLRNDTRCPFSVGG